MLNAARSSGLSDYPLQFRQFLHAVRHGVPDRHILEELELLLSSDRTGREAYRRLRDAVSALREEEACEALEPTPNRPGPCRRCCTAPRGIPLLSVPPGMVLIVFDGLHAIDWASMEHAYGSAEEVPALLWALRSPDAEERRKALDRFYGVVHHQGSVYPPTVASLPFLFELAADGATPDRAGVVVLLVSIGRESFDRGFEDDGTEIERYPPMGCAQAVAFLRARGVEFAELACDPDPDVRLAAIPGLGLFLDDADRAAAMLRERLADERGIAARRRMV